LFPTGSTGTPAGSTGGAPPKGSLLMKLSTRAAAVVAAAALAVSTATGTAAAQSGLPASGDTLAPLGGAAGESGGGSAALAPLEGSTAPEGSSGLLEGSSDIGSAEMAPLSTNLLGGSSELPPLSVDPLSGSSEFQSSDIGSTDMAPLSTNLLGGSAEIGSTDMAPLSTNLLGGSATFESSELAPLTGSTGMGSQEMSPLSTELNFLGGSAELPPLSANFPDGSTEGIGASSEAVGGGINGSLTNGSAGDITEPLGGSITDGGSAEPIVGSIAEGDVTGALAGSIESMTGSIAGDTGSTGGSADVLTGSADDLTDVNGSLTSFTGSLANGSDQGVGSTNTGSGVGQDSSLETVGSVSESAGPGLLPILSIGGVGLAAGAALGAGVDLPPLRGSCVPPDRPDRPPGSVSSARAVHRHRLRRVGEQPRDHGAELGRIPLGALVLRCGTLPAVTHGDLAALDLEDAAGDVAGGLRAEPHHERRDVGGVHGVEGAVLGRRHLGGHALAGRGGHPGAGRRGDRVGGDAVALHLRGGLDGEQGDAR